MLVVLLAMLLTLVLAGAVVVYVAFPHRGEAVPHTPWVGEAMRRGVAALPTLDNQRAWERDAEHDREHDMVTVDGRERVSLNR